jgi:hypothetical protein
MVTCRRAGDAVASCWHPAYLLSFQSYWCFLGAQVANDSANKFRGRGNGKSRNKGWSLAPQPQPLVAGRFDLDVDPRREAQFIERLDGFGGRLNDID